MNLFLSISISGYGPFPSFMCVKSCFAVFLALIRPVICDDLSPMAPWGSRYTPSCCYCCCGSHNKGFVPWVVDNLLVSPDSLEFWRIDNMESAVHMEHVCFVVDINVEFVEDMGDVIFRQIE